MSEITRRYYALIESQPPELVHTIGTWITGALWMALLILAAVMA